MKNSKLTRPLALLLVLVMVLSCAPHITLHTHADPTVAEQVDALQYFKQADLATYQGWVSQLAGSPTQLARVEKAITVLSADRTLDVYDDMSNVGSYTTSGQPADKWSAYTTSGTPTSQWQILWGGLTGNQTNSYTLPGAHSGVATLQFAPFDFTTYTNEGYTSGYDNWKGTIADSIYSNDAAYNSGYSWGYMYSNASDPTSTKYDFTGLLGGLNWATPGYVTGNDDISRITGTGRLSSQPAIIFDYKEPGYFSYLTVLTNWSSSLAYLTAVVVENYVAVREVKIQQITEAGYYGHNLFRSGDAMNRSVFDFDMVWDEDYDCYKFSIQLNNIETAQNLGPGDGVVSNLWSQKTVYLKDGVQGQNFTVVGGTGEGILSNTAAKKLTQFYVSTNPRTCRYAEAPLTRLAVAFDQACDHSGNFEYKATEDGSKHDKICLLCLKTAEEGLEHSYPNTTPAVGDKCTLCDYEYGKISEGDVKRLLKGTHVFKAADIETYREWLTLLTDQNSAEYIRLNRAITKLSAQGVTFYDDLSNIGDYAAEDLPAGKWEAFPDADKTSQWNILWGGLSGTGVENYTLPAEHMVGHPTLKFKPFHFTAYSTLNENVLLGGMNWATPSYIGAGKKIESVTGSVIIPNLPTVIFDYKAPGYYSYITILVDSNPFYVAAVVVEDYVAVRQVKLHQLGDSAGQMNDNWMDPSNGLGIFSMAWDAAEGCYRLKIDLQSPKASSAYPGTDGTETTFGGSGPDGKNPNLHFNVLLKNSASFVAVSGTDTNILSNAQPAKLEQLYVSTDYRATAQGGTPFTNFSISTVEGCEHTAIENSKTYKKSDANCLSGTVYWDECSKCHMLMSTTWTDTDVQQHSVTLYMQEGNGTHHHKVCAVCKDPATATESQTHQYVGGVCVCGRSENTNLPIVSDAKSAADAVDAQMYFLSADLGTLEFWLIQLNGSTYADQYSRLNKAVTALKAGATYYDDLSNIGQYETDSVPSNKWSTFPDADKVSEWNIIWGGLTGEGVNNYTLPKDYIENHPTLTFHPFHFSAYTVDGYSSAQKDWTGTATDAVETYAYGYGKEWKYKEGRAWGYMYDANGKAYDFTRLLGGINWASPGYVAENQLVNKVTGTLNLVSAPAIIFDYQNPGFFSYLTIFCASRDSQAYLTAVVVENFKAVREVKLHKLYDAGNGNNWLADYLYTSLGDFTLEWDDSQNCYKFSLKSGAINTVTATPGAAAGEANWNNANMDPVIYLKNDVHGQDFQLIGAADPKDTSTNILSNATPKKLKNVYISTNPRSLNLVKDNVDDTPAITRLGITTVDSDHICVGTTYKCVIPATCAEAPQYAWVCECGEWTSALAYEGHAVDHIKGEIQHDADGHWYNCKTCGIQMDAANHDYGNYATVPGAACLYCGYIRGTDDLQQTVTDINAIRLFKREDLTTYQTMMDKLSLVKDEDEFVAAYNRLSKAVAAILAGASFYDDLSDIGDYTTGTDLSGMDKWDEFPVSGSQDNLWKLIWGGLEGDNVNSYTLPQDYVSGYPTLKFSPFHFTAYTVDGYASTGTDWKNTVFTPLDYEEVNQWGQLDWFYKEGYEWGKMYVEENSYDFTALLGGLNWATPTYLDANSNISKITATAIGASFPAVIFDYQSEGNFSYLTIFGNGTSQAYMTAVVVKDFKAIREVKLHTFGEPGSSPNWLYAQYNTQYDFSLIWDYEQGCYVLSVYMGLQSESPIPGSDASKYNWNGNANYVFSVVLKDGVEGQNFTCIGSDVPENNSSSIISGEAPAQVPAVYVSTNPRGLNLEQAAVLTQLAVTQVPKGHTAHTFDQKIEDITHAAVAPDCTQKGQYYYSCVCGANGTETFEGSALGNHVLSSHYSFDETGHWNYCSLCYEKPGQTETHRMDEDTHTCIICSYRELPNVNVSSFLPEILGSKLLTGLDNLNQKLRIDVDFSAAQNAAGQNVVIKYYGVAVLPKRSGMTVYDVQAFAIANPNGGNGVAINEYVAGNEPATVTAVVNVSAGQYGQTMALVAFVVDENGTYYFSENSNSDVGLENGMISTSVMSIMKNILAADGAYASKADAAAETYFASNNKTSAVIDRCGDVGTLKGILNGYLNGTISDGHADFEVAEEITRWVFAYCGEVQ